MGSRGIRRRRPAHHLPKVPDGEMSTENDVIPPNIMWPEAGSGFEADPFSPAGSAQRGWLLLNSARRGRTRPTRVFGWVYIVLVGAGLIAFLVGGILQLTR